MGICHKNGANSSMIPCHFFNLKKKTKKQKEKRKTIKRHAYKKREMNNTESNNSLFYVYSLS